MDCSKQKCSNCSQFKKRILVTGGAGFIGSHVVILLVKKYPEYLIVNLDKLDYCASLQNLDEVKAFPNYKFIQGDICEPDFMRYIFQEEFIDIVVHFAAQTHVDLSFWSSLDFTRINVFGTHVLINAAYEAGVELFVYASTDEVYGGNSLVELSEGAKMCPTNPYAASKAAAECIVVSYWQAFKFPVIITRSNNIYGPHQYPEKVIPKFISLIERGRPCCIHGNGSAVRNFLFATDAAKAFDIIIHKGSHGEIYNIGSQSALSVYELAVSLIKKLKKDNLQRSEEDEQLKKYLDYVEDRPYNDLRYPMDSSKIQALGWSEEVSWEQGLQVTIDWYRNPMNFHHWPEAEDVLKPYPSGSNTMRLGSQLRSRRAFTSPRHSPYFKKKS